MQATSSGDQIRQLLHVIVIEICQSIVSYSNELVVSGAVFVRADGVEICNVSFEDSITKNSCKAMDMKSSNGKDKMAAAGESNSFAQSSSGVQRSQTFIPRPTRSDNDSTTIDHENISTDNGCCTDIRNFVSLKNNISLKKLAKGKCKSRRHETKLSRISNDESSSNFFLAKDECLNNSRFRESNSGERVLKYWEQISPEILKVSAFLFQLGELQKNVGNGCMMPSDIINNKSHKNLQKWKHSGRKKRINSSTDVRDKNSRTTTGDKSSKTLHEASNVKKCHHNKNQCRLCHREFSFVTNLIRHQKNIHRISLKRHNMTSTNHTVSLTNQLQIDCSVCGNVFADLALLKFHKETEHLTPERIGCNSVSRLSSGGFMVKHLVHSDTISSDDNNISPLDVSAVLSKEIEVSLPIRSIDERLPEEFIDSKIENEIINEETAYCSERNPEDRSLSFDSNRITSLAVDHQLIDDCWDKSRDSSIIETISVDVCDDNSSNYFDGCRASSRTENGCNQVIIPQSSSNAADNQTTTGTSPDSLKSCDSFEPRMKRFQCTLCSASFSMSNNLQRHTKKIHATQKEASHHFPITYENPLIAAAEQRLMNFRGTSSSMTRVSSSSRYRHICILCQAAFTFRTNLTRHMKKIHGKIPFDVSSASNE